MKGFKHPKGLLVLGSVSLVAVALAFMGQGPEAYLLSLSMLPLLGMAVGDNVTRMDDWKPPDFPEKPRRPVPWERYPSLIPFLLVEFVMFAFHSVAFDQIIDLWRDIFVARVPIIGDITKLILPHLTLGSMTVLLIAGFIVVCPVILSSQMIKYGVLEPGFKLERLNGVAWVMIGIPGAMYLTAIGTEGYGMYYRMMSETVAQEITSTSGIDPSLPLMIIISVLSLGITTIVGFATAKAMHEIHHL